MNGAWSSCGRVFFWKILEDSPQKVRVLGGKVCFLPLLDQKLLGIPSIQCHQHILRHGLDSTRRFGPWNLGALNECRWFVFVVVVVFFFPDCSLKIHFLRPRRKKTGIPRSYVWVTWESNLWLPKGTLCGAFFGAPTESRLWQRPKGYSPNFVETLKHNQNVRSGNTTFLDVMFGSMFSMCHPFHHLCAYWIYPESTRPPITMVQWKMCVSVSPIESSPFKYFAIFHWLPWLWEKE